MQKTIFHWGQCGYHQPVVLMLIASYSSWLQEIRLLAAENALVQPHGHSPSLQGWQQPISVLPSALHALPNPKRDLYPSGTVQWCQGYTRLQSLLQLLERRALWVLASAHRSCAVMSMGAEQTPSQRPLGFYDKATVIHKIHLCIAFIPPAFLLSNFVSHRPANLLPKGCLSSSKSISSA